MLDKINVGIVSGKYNTTIIQCSINNSLQLLVC